MTPFFQKEIAMKFIKSNEKLIAIICEAHEFKKGLNFITPDDLFIQTGLWWYDKGKILDNHIHKKNQRITDLTQESIYVIKGSLKVNLFDEEMQFIESVIINKGDVAIMSFGGHGYEILENDTMVIESKNGPFIGVAEDKKKF